MRSNESTTGDLGERLGLAVAELGDSGVVAAYLFGSHAAGRAHRESDVDVGLLLDWGRYRSRAARFDARVRFGSALGAALHRNDIDVVILNDCPPMLGRRIVTEGLRVSCVDAELDRAFVRDVQIRAADLAPWLRRARRATLAAIAR